MCLSAAFSPCPNTTFAWYGWIQGRVGVNCPIDVTHADIQVLNQQAHEYRHDISQTSIYCAGQLLNDYILLPVGVALGQNCGPKVVSKELITSSNLAGKRIAFPGQNTSAYLLFQLLFPSPVEFFFCRYDEVLGLVRDGTVDAGVIIHETRFTFQTIGLREVADLGQEWGKRFSLPLPLGSIIAKRKLGQERLAAITRALKASINYGWDHFDEAFPYVQAHSIEKGRPFIEKFIRLYVNDETYQLSQNGKEAIETLFCTARRANLLPPSIQSWLFDPSRATI